MTRLLHDPENPAASRFRLFWAFYIDFCIYSVVLSFVNLLTANKIVILTGQFAFLTMFLLIIPLQWFLIVRFNIQTIGYKALGIYLNPDQQLPLFDPQKFLVDRHIKDNESWITMFIGIMLINDGCKQMIQWMLNHQLPPLFGVNLSGSWAIFFSILIGFFLIRVGVGILRLKTWAAYAAIGYFSLVIIGILIVYPQAAQWASQQMLIMSQERGKELSSTELRSSASMLVNILVVMGVFVAASVFKNLFRFRK